MRLLPALLFLLIFPVSLSAQCIDIDTTGWTKDDKNLRVGIAYNMVYTSTGINSVPHMEGESICFPDSIPNLSGILTKKKMADRIVSNAAENTARQTAFDNEKRVRREALESKFTPDELKAMKELVHD